MSKQILKTTTLGAALICGAYLQSFGETKVERSPLEIGSYIDIGQVVKGGYADPTITVSPDGAMLQRTAVYLNQTTTINDRLSIKVGVGGLFYYAFPEDATYANTRSIHFGPGVGQAQGIYKLGDLNNPDWTFQFGYFPYKYNSDAKNLGEYLLRDGTYPGYEVTGVANWSYMNSALYMASGFRVNRSFLDGKLSADLNVFLERDIGPNHDLSPSFLVSYKPTNLVDLGAGVEFAHFLPIIPHIIKGSQYLIRNDSAVDISAPIDSGSRYTFQGVKLMARASFNFGAMLNNPWIGNDGLKLYTEAAILGVKNYPFYYDNISQRMPVMVGINLPTLDFFDVIAFEYEYRNWAFLNSTNLVLQNQPYYDQTPYAGGYDPSNPPENVKAQDNKWSVYAKKTIVKGVAIYAQAASDYLRAVDQNNNLTHLPITQRPSQWYYLFRLEFGI